MQVHLKLSVPESVRKEFAAFAKSRGFEMSSVFVEIWNEAKKQLRAKYPERVKGEKSC